MELAAGSSSVESRKWLLSTLLPRQISSMATVQNPCRLHTLLHVACGPSTLSTNALAVASQPTTVQLAGTPVAIKHSHASGYHIHPGRSTDRVFVRQG